MATAIALKAVSEAMSRVKTQAIAIRRIDYSETSQIVSFFTREFGKVQIIAKGIKRSGKNKPANPIDLLNLYQLVYFQKSGGERAESFRAKEDGLSILAEADLLNGFRGLHENLSAQYAALWCLEVLDTFLHPGGEYEDYFDFFLDTLLVLETGSSLENHVLNFQVKTLLHFGHFPSLDRCAHCGGLLKKEPEHIHFSFKEGGIVCLNCLDKCLPYVRIAFGVIRLLARLTELRFEEVKNFPMPQWLLMPAFALLRDYFRYGFQQEWELARYFQSGIST